MLPPFPVVPAPFPQAVLAVPWGLGVPEPGFSAGLKVNPGRTGLFPVTGFEPVRAEFPVLKLIGH